MSKPALKTGWTRVKFGDVVRLNTERCADPLAAGIERYVGLDHIDPEDSRLRRWGQVSEGITFTNLFRPGQVLFGKRRAYQRKVAVPDFGGVCSSDIYVFETQDPNRLLPELLPFICQTEGFFEYAVGTSAGSLSPRTNWTHLTRYEFALAPLEAQRQLADVLRAADKVCAAALDTMEAAHALLDAIDQDAFKHVLSVGIEPSVRLGDLFVPVTDKGYTDLPILSITIDGRAVRRTSLDRHVSDETGDEKYIRVLPKDLAYNTMRLWQGAIGIVQEEGLISPAYTVMRLVDKQYPIGYFHRLFRSTPMQREYRRFVKGVAPDRWRLYYNDLATISVKLPSSDQVSALAGQFNELAHLVYMSTSRHRQSIGLRSGLIESVLGGVNAVH